jgi:hypothetical protein
VSEREIVRVCEMLNVLIAVPTMVLLFNLIPFYSFVGRFILIQIICIWTIIIIIIIIILHVEWNWQIFVMSCTTTRSKRQKQIECFLPCFFFIFSMIILFMISEEKCNNYAFTNIILYYQSWIELNRIELNSIELNFRLSDRVN